MAARSPLALKSRSLPAFGDLTLFKIRWIGVAAALIAAYGAGLLYEMVAAPAGCCALTWPSLDPIQAERLLARTDPMGKSAAAQALTARTVLAARPGEPSAWMRLAYADRLQHGRLTDAGQHALDTSYLIAPYVGNQTPWRLAFALNNWDTLLPATRKAVVQEINLTAQDGTIREATGRLVASSVHDPSGRLAAVLLGLDLSQPAGS
jgi:hypothetical protein